MRDDSIPSTQRLTRPNVPALDAILGEPLRVLDQGFVRVIDYLGDDNAVVQAARVSYGAGTKKVNEDRGLIRYLMRHDHTTPFEMCEIKLHVRVPMDTWRQWIRHRTANVNEYSTRYSLAIDAASVTDPGEWRMQSASNRQGSEGFFPADVGAQLSSAEADLHALTAAAYKARIDQGVAREQARKDLPLSTYTEAYWKVDLHNLLRFLWLRMDAHAQAEIRAYATLIGESIVARWVPNVWEAFNDYTRNSVRLSSLETEVLRTLLAEGHERAIARAVEIGVLSFDANGTPKRNREREELEAKLRRLGAAIPW
jgi:thymidylate synthase (FAD)